ncbi:MAG: histidine--tRNA ligase, partial [Fusobacteriaceae bacterium]|nr:histidine--tRNA ligase [Fusobacteriaceae bacterium]
LGVKYALIIGEDEIKNGKYILKDFKNREQVEVALDEIKGRLK